MLLETFGDLVNFVAARVGAARQDLERIDFYCEDALRKVWRRFQSPERKRMCEVYAKPTLEGFKVAVIRNSLIVSRVSGPIFTQDLVGGHLIVFGNPSYRVASVEDDDNLTLHRPWFEATNALQPVAFYWDTIDLPSDVAEVVEDEIILLCGECVPLDWIDETEGRRIAQSPRAVGRPTWVTPGMRTPGDHGLYDVRSLRFGPRAFDNNYPIQIGFYNHYPPLPPREQGRLATRLLLPVGRRSLAAWHALSVAYSEHPFTDGTQAERWEGKYEREMDIALKAEKESATDVAYLETFDR